MQTTMLHVPGELPATTIHLQTDAEPSRPTSTRPAQGQDEGERASVGGRCDQGSGPCRAGPGTSKGNVPRGVVGRVALRVDVQKYFCLASNSTPPNIPTYQTIKLD